LSTIDEIKAKFKLKDLALSLNGLEKVNDNCDIAICLFHDDNKPSMRLYHDSQNIHCFACGKHGDVIDLYAAIHRITNKEAIRQMAEGISTQVNTVTDKTDWFQRKRDEVKQLERVISEGRKLLLYKEFDRDILECIARVSIRKDCLMQLNRQDEIRRFLK